MFRYIRNKLLGATKKQIGRNTARSPRQLRFEGLEVRQMMTAGLVSAATQLQGTALPALVAPAGGIQAHDRQTGAGASPTPASPGFSCAQQSGGDAVR